MRSRFILLALAAMVMAVTFSYSDWRWPWSRPRQSMVEVRWPATSPVDEVLPRAAPPEEPAEPLLPPTEVAPGIRVREGMAHDLSYFEIILGDADFDDALPLVVLLHGRGDRPRIPGGPFRGVPIPMRLIVPRGPLRLGAGFAWILASVTQGRPDVLAASLRNRTHHVAALIDTLYRTRPTLGRPIVSGFSQGALLAFSLALHRPDVVVRALPLAGWVPPDLMPLVPTAPELRVPIRAVHGAEDLVIPIVPTREVIARLRELEWEVELAEFEGVGHVVSPEMNAMFEAWLEQALREQAPGGAGQGLGVDGPEDEPYEPWEPLDEETLEAIEQLEAQEAASSETGDDASKDDADENEAGGDGTGDERVVPPRQRAGPTLGRTRGYATRASSGVRPATPPRRRGRRSSRRRRAGRRPDCRAPARASAIR